MNRAIIVVIALIVVALIVVFAFVRQPGGQQTAPQTAPPPAEPSAQPQAGSGEGLCGSPPAAAEPFESSTLTALRTEDTTVGTGEEAEAGDTVAVQYIGRLSDGTQFDSSCSRGQPFEFPLGTGQVIQGWDQGVAGMRVGGRRRLLIPSSLGYGEQGAGGAIPPNAALVFDVELVAIR